MISSVFDLYCTTGDMRISPSSSEFCNEEVGGGDVIVSSLIIPSSSRTMNHQKQKIGDGKIPRPKKMYTVGCPLSRDILLSVYGIFHRALSWYCSYRGPILVTGTSKIKQNNTSRLRSCPTVYSQLKGPHFVKVIR